MRTGRRGRRGAGAGAGAGGLADRATAAAMPSRGSRGRAVSAWGDMGVPRPGGRSSAISPAGRRGQERATCVCVYVPCVRVVAAWRPLLWAASLGGRQVWTQTSPQRPPASSACPALWEPHSPLAVRTARPAFPSDSPPPALLPHRHPSVVRSVLFPFSVPSCCSSSPLAVSLVALNLRVPLWNMHRMAHACGVSRARFRR